MRGVGRLCRGVLLGAQQGLRATAGSHVRSSHAGPAVVARSLVTSARVMMAAQKGDGSSGGGDGKKHSMLDDVLQSASSQASRPRAMRNRQTGRRGGNGTNASGGQGGQGGQGGRGGRGGRDDRGGRGDNRQQQQQQHQQQQQQRQGRGRGGLEPPRQAMKSYADWKLGEIKKLEDEFQQHIAAGNLTEGSPEAEEIRKMLADAKKDLKPPTPPVPVTVNLPDGTTRRQYAFDTPAVPPLPAREKITPGVIHTFAVYNKRVSNMTRGGRRPSMAALVLAGNGVGGLGFAMAKGAETRLAEEKAANRAKRRMEYIYRLDNRTIAHDVQAKYLKTKVYMRPAKPGHGVKAHPLIQMMCELAGIEDLTADVVGSTNPLNVAHAAMEAFKAQRDPVDIAKMRGKTLIQIDDPGRLPRVLYTPPPSAAPTVPLPGDVRRSVKSWLRAFPRPGDMAALGSAKLAFDKLVSNAWTERGEDGRHFRNKLIHVRGGLAIVKGLDDDISAWFQSQPPRASPMDLQVYTRKSFLDDSFWPGGVHASLDYHATISTAGTTTSASTQQQ